MKSHEAGDRWFTKGIIFVLKLLNLILAMISTN
jgi:hypothetical protein